MHIERIFEESHIRRGRLATSPTFVVLTPDGARWRFMRRRDAQRFVDAGGVCVDHKPFCCDCGGRREAP